MCIKLLTELSLECLSIKGGDTGSSESTLVKMSYCWKLHVRAHMVSLDLIKMGWNVVKRREKAEENNNPDFLVCRISTKW